MGMQNIPPNLQPLCDRSGRLETAWFCAQQAAFFLINDRPENLKVSSKTTSSDLVSLMDKASEDMIVRHILSSYPLDGVVGEEGANKVGSSDTRWIIDPLDGTVNYLFGIPLWGVSIAIETRGVVEFGIVVIPAQGETYVAKRGGGAFRVTHQGIATAREQDAVAWGEQIQVRKSETLATSLVMTGFGYSPSRRSLQAELVQKIIPAIADIRRGGAAVVDLCWFAAGRSDAYYEFGLNTWDYAAGALIAQEAGGIVQGLDTPDFSRFLIAATPQISEALRQLLTQSGAHDLFNH